MSPNGREASASSDTGASRRGLFSRGPPQPEIRSHRPLVHGCYRTPPGPVVRNFQLAEGNSPCQNPGRWSIVGMSVSLTSGFLREFLFSNISLPVWNPAPGDGGGSHCHWVGLGGRCAQAGASWGGSTVLVSVWNRRDRAVLECPRLSPHGSKSPDRWDACRCGARRDCDVIFIGDRRHLRSNTGALVTLANDKCRGCLGVADRDCGSELL